MMIPLCVCVLLLLYEKKKVVSIEMKIGNLSIMLKKMKFKIIELFFLVNMSMLFQFFPRKKTFISQNFLVYSVNNENEPIKNDKNEDVCIFFR